MFTRDNSLIGWARSIANFTALAVALGVPLGHFYVGYLLQRAELDTHVNQIVRPLSELISKNTELWQFEENRLRSILSERSQAHREDLRRIRLADGTLVMEYPEGLADTFPLSIRSQQKIYDYGKVLGHLEFSTSLAPLLIRSAFVALLSGLAGLAIFWFLSVYPLRALMNSWSKISFLASHDPLTGLANRAYFLDRLESAITDAERRSESIVVYCVDLDHFKDVNDTLGHAVGDRLLKDASLRMLDCIGDLGTLARLGGDEFAILQTGVNDPDASALLAERLIAELSRPFLIDGVEVIVSGSIGIAIRSAHERLAPDQLLKNADLALYKSKEKRRSYTFFQEDLDAEMRERKSLEMDVRRALREGELHLVYQPQVDARTGSLVGLEVLTRWSDAKRGNVPPTAFIPVIERIGLMPEFTRWVLETACSTSLEWGSLQIAVNVSASMFNNDDLIGMVDAVLSETGFPASRLELEITEEVLLADAEMTVGVLKGLKGLGVKIAVDDFGKGYSSLGYMRLFRFDTVKIDRSFVTDIPNDQSAQAIVQAIVGMCRALNMKVLAEGVETKGELDILVDEGCDQLQGYYLGRPMTALRTLQLLYAPQAGADAGKHVQAA